MCICLCKYNIRIFILLLALFLPCLLYNFFAIVAYNVYCLHYYCSYCYCCCLTLRLCMLLHTLTGNSLLCLPFDRNCLVKSDKLAQYLPGFYYVPAWVCDFWVIIDILNDNKLPLESIPKYKHTYEMMNMFKFVKLAALPWERN